MCSHTFYGDCTQWPADTFLCVHLKSTAVSDCQSDDMELATWLCVPQNLPQHPLPAMRLLTFVNCLALVTLAIFYTLLRALFKRRPSPQLEVRGAL